jgi:hypothetical protein
MRAMLSTAGSSIAADVQQRFATATEQAANAHAMYKRAAEHSVLRVAVILIDPKVCAFRYIPEVGPVDMLEISVTPDLTKNSKTSC